MSSRLAEATQEPKARVHHRSFHQRPKRAPFNSSHTSDHILPYDIHNRLLGRFDGWLYRTWGIARALTLRPTSPSFSLLANTENDPPDVNHAAPPHQSSSSVSKSAGLTLAAAAGMMEACQGMCTSWTRDRNRSLFVLCFDMFVPLNHQKLIELLIIQFFSHSFFCFYPI